MGRLHAIWSYVDIFGKISYEEVGCYNTQKILPQKLGENEGCSPREKDAIKYVADFQREEARVDLIASRC